MKSTRHGQAIKGAGVNITEPSADVFKKMAARTEKLVIIYTSCQGNALKMIVDLYIP
jgi:hypothetical protein